MSRAADESPSPAREDARFECVLPTWDWSDGLPLVHPDEGLLVSMLGTGAGEHGAEDVLGIVPPGFRPVTRRQAAEVAVMAGCRPELFPVVEAAVRCTLEPEFNLLGIQATTEPASPLLIVNGAARTSLNINSGANVFGNSPSGNAPIGRAVRLILTRWGGAIPGITDMATFGHPGKITYCIGENEEANPWEPLHADRGFSRDDNVVTVIGADAPINVLGGVRDADALLTMIALALATPTVNNAVFGGEMVVVLSPEHAESLASAGLSKAEVKSELFQRASVDSAVLPAPVRELWANTRPSRALEPTLRPVASPDGVLLVVAGGIGSHSMVVPTFGATKAVSKEFPV